MDGSPRDDQLPPLPGAYRNDTFRTLARDAETIFVWWDMNPDTVGDAPLFLRVETESGDVEQLVSLDEIVGDQFVEVGEPGTTYTLTLGQQSDSGDWSPVTPFLPVRLPPAHPPEGDPVYVTITPDA